MTTETINLQELLQNLTITYCDQEMCPVQQVQQVQQVEEIEEIPNPFPKWATRIAYIVTIFVVFYIAYYMFMNQDKTQQQYMFATQTIIPFILGALHFLHIDSIKQYIAWLYDYNNLF